MAAKESALGALHEALTELFLDDIRLCREEGIPNKRRALWSIKQL